METTKIIDKPSMVVVYVDDEKAYFYSCLVVDWGDEITKGHKLHEIHTDDLLNFFKEDNLILIQKNIFTTREDILSAIDNYLLKLPDF